MCAFAHCPFGPRFKGWRGLWNLWNIFSEVPVNIGDHLLVAEIGALLAKEEECCWGKSACDRTNFVPVHTRRCIAWSCVGLCISAKRSHNLDHLVVVEIGSLQIHYRLLMVFAANTIVQYQQSTGQVFLAQVVVPSLNGDAFAASHISGMMRTKGGGLFEIQTPPPSPSPSRPPKLFVPVFLQFEISGKGAGAKGPKGVKSTTNIFDPRPDLRVGPWLMASLS